MDRRQYLHNVVGEVQVNMRQLGRKWSRCRRQFPPIRIAADANHRRRRGDGPHRSELPALRHFSRFVLFFVFFPIFFCCEKRKEEKEKREMKKLKENVFD